MMNMKELMRLQNVMQKKMQKLEEDLNAEQVEGTSGGGAVKIVMTCKKHPIRVTISKDAVDPEDVETLEDLVFSALKAANDNAEARAQAMQEELASSLNLPPGMMPGL